MFKRLWLLFWLGLAGILIGQWWFVVLAIAVAPFGAIRVMAWVWMGRKPRAMALASQPPPLPLAERAAAYGARLAH